MRDVMKRELQQFFLRIANDFAQLTINAKPSPRRAYVSNADTGQLKRGAVHLLAFTEGALESRTSLKNLLHIDRAREFRDGWVEEALVAGYFIESIR